VALLLCAFDASLESEQSFDSLKQSLGSPVAQFFIWASLAALAYHFVAGIRHLIMDFGFGEDSFESGRNSAWVVVAVAAILILSITGWVFLW
ncbi:succinate dehydrogenase, cytochrome b556 subunit, partial [Porticoccaceae bacterium]|nr:succinate dehydrogenase, cytochrome b556 subunit [Porticoccaceae bacterium]